MSKTKTKICEKCGTPSMYQLIGCECSCHCTTGMICD